MHPRASLPRVAATPPRAWPAKGSLRAVRNPVDAVRKWTAHRPTARRARGPLQQASTTRACDARDGAAARLRQPARRLPALSQLARRPLAPQSPRPRRRRGRLRRPSDNRNPRSCGSRVAHCRRHRARGACAARSGRAAHPIRWVARTPHRRVRRDAPRGRGVRSGSAGIRTCGAAASRDDRRATARAPAVRSGIHRTGRRSRSSGEGNARVHD